MTLVLPRAGAPLVDGAGPPTREHYRWCSLVTEAINAGQLTGTTAQEAIAAIATALGSPDGTVANIPADAGGKLSDDTLALGLKSIEHFGSLADGQVSFALRGDVADPGASYVYGTDADGDRGWRHLATTDNLDEGAANRYFTEARVDARVGLLSDVSYGTVGDGVADDKAALDAAAAAAVARGRTLALDGTKVYGVSGFLALPAGLRLQTNGATFRDLVGTTSNTPFITISANSTVDELYVEIPAGIRRDRAVLVPDDGPPIHRISITALSQQANTLENDDAALRVLSASGSRVCHVAISGYDNAAIFRSSPDLRMLSLTINSYVRGVQVEDCARLKIHAAAIRGASPNTSYVAGNVGVLLSASSNDAQRNVTLEDFIVEDAGEHGIRIGGPFQQSNIHIVRPRIKNCGGSGIKILGTDSGTPTELNKRIFITDPIIEDCGSGGITSNMCGILVMFAEHVTITNPVIRKESKLYSGHSGIRVAASSDVTISNPRCRDAQNDGIFLDGSLGDLTRVNVAAGGWSRLNGRDGYRAETFTATFTDCMVDGLHAWNNTGKGGNLVGAGGLLLGRPTVRMFAAANTGGQIACDLNTWTLHIEGGVTSLPTAGIFARNGSTWNDHVNNYIRKAVAWTAL